MADKGTSVGKDDIRKAVLKLKRANDARSNATAVLDVAILNYEKAIEVWHRAVAEKDAADVAREKAIAAWTTANAVRNRLERELGELLQ